MQESMFLEKVFKLGFTNQSILAIDLKRTKLNNLLVKSGARVEFNLVNLHEWVVQADIARAASWNVRFNKNMDNFKFSGLHLKETPA